MAAPTPDAIRITPDNVGTYRTLHGLLRKHLHELAQMTLKYPVEISFRGIRFVFDSEADIRRAIALIDEQLSQHSRELAPA